MQRMSIRIRLVIGFVLISLFVLVLFGIVTHRTTLEINHNYELSLLKSFVTDQANTLDNQLSQGASIDQLAQQLPLINSSFSRFVLLDQHNQLIDNHSSYDSFNIRLSEFPFQQLLSTGLSGSITLNQHYYAWAAKPLQENKFTLFMLHQSEYNPPANARALGKRMLITALVITWLAFWVALIFSKRIIRQLDEKNAALTHKALYDDLTSLPNRYRLHESLQQLNNNTSYALLVVDLNNLRDINDTLGHRSGDELLKVAAERISQTATPNLIVARLSGDEFAVLLETNTPHQAEEIARKILYEISKPIHIDEMDIVTHASIGCAHYPHDAETPDSLLNRAEVSMFHAKQTNINYQAYNNEIDPLNKQRLELMSSLRKAIDQGQLRAYYQPKIELATQHTTGVEVLVRWQHPEKGIINPDEFIPIAERCNLIDKLTHWVLDEALRQCHMWKQNDLDLTVAVNLSARNLLDANLASQVEALLTKWQIPAKQLKLEVTESMIMSDPETALHTLNRLNTMGVSLSVDDYGTGYSSLAYIKKLPIQEIKIDRTFVKDMLHNRDDSVIVQSTIELAHNLGLCVVAEGVENEATLQRLAELQCNRAQGYYMSRPLPATQFEEWLQTCKWPAAQ